MVLFASHKKAEFSHAFSATSRNGLTLGDLTSACAVAVLLVKLFFASLTLALQSLDNVDSSTDVSVVIDVEPLSGLSLVAHGATTGQRLGVSESRTAGKVEVDLAASRRSKRCGDGSADRGRRLCLSRRLTIKQRLG